VLLQVVHHLVEGCLRYPFLLFLELLQVFLLQSPFLRRKLLLPLLSFPECLCLIDAFLNVLSEPLLLELEIKRCLLLVLLDALLVLFSALLVIVKGTHLPLEFIPDGLLNFFILLNQLHLCLDPSFFVLLLH